MAKRINEHTGEYAGEYTAIAVSQDAQGRIWYRIRYDDGTELEVSYDIARGTKTVRLPWDVIADRADKAVTMAAVWSVVTIGAMVALTVLGFMSGFIHW